MTTTRNRTNGARHNSQSAADMNGLAVPPQNLQAEKSVLGGMILSDAAIDAASGIMRPEHHYSDAHQTIHRAFVKLRSENRQIDIVTLMDELQQQGVLEDIGGPPYLNEIMETVPHAAHTASYAKTVVKMSRHRAGIDAGRELIAGARDLTTDIDETLAAAETKLHAAIEGGLVAGPKSLGDVLIDVGDHLHDEFTGLRSGFAELDRLTKGLQRASLTIGGARPSVGKTSFAAKIMANVASSGVGALFVTYEQPSRDIAHRLLGMKAGIPFDELKGMPNHYAEIANELARLPIQIDDTGPDINRLVATIRLAARKGVGLVVVDYLQLIVPEDPRVIREQQIATSSRKLKQVAMSCNIAVLLLSQLNREVEKRDGGRPRLSDLRESGAIEQDADACWLLWRPHKDSADGSCRDDVARIDVAKNRNGATGLIDLNWHGPSMTFSDVGGPQ
ncbi:MAG: replicative DNA helicase [Planctomycetaceae bacterium]|nr:replicative DNA helicase [Planctomycetaceae bacterium]